MIKIMECLSKCVLSNSAEQTKKLGFNLGRLLKPGIVVALTGDLGSGKTVFAQGLARGLDVPRTYYITSPTFTLINEYPGRVPFFHVDLYRLAAYVDTEDIGLDEIIHGGNAVAVEWADRLDSKELCEHLTIAFKTTGDTSREISFTAFGSEPCRLLKSVE